MSRTPRRRRAGMSLLEVSIASIILVLVVLMTLSVMIAASGTAAKGTIGSDLETRGRAFIDFCKSQFMTARFSDLSSFNTLLRYQIPVSQNAAGQVQFGYSVASGYNDPSGVGKTCVLRFEADLAIRESSSAPITAQATNTAGLPLLPVLQTRVANLDVNRDGDRNDTFVRGKIVQYVLAATGLVERRSVLSDQAMLAVASSGRFNGDFDGSAATPADRDWLFRYVDASGATITSATPGTNSAGIRVTVHHGTWDDTGKNFMVRRATEMIYFRNDQP
ncbi:MAG TPA: hypothetical protein VNO22_02780 [Planctomycetota bacterium]|nr:hypothetical protein [Planctomycetota bacterium]